MDYAYKKKVQKGWQAWIDSELFLWNWYVTLTFATVIHPESADKSFRKWILILNKEMYGNNFKRKGLGCYWVRASEFQQRGALHYHLLMGNILPIIRRLSFMDIWHNKFKGFSKIEKYDKERKATSYLTKYIMKDGDIEIGGNLDNVVRQFELL